MLRETYIYSDILEALKLIILNLERRQLCSLIQTQNPPIFVPVCQYVKMNYGCPGRN